MKKTELKIGDTVSLQSLSSGLAGEEKFRHKFQLGKSRVEELGLKTEVSKHALKGIDFLYKYPQQRALDLMEAFKNPKIKAVFANIGGSDSHKLIPFLDIDLIQRNPKPILGFSDITSLHLFMYNLGVQTYYGPSVMDGFAENVNMHKFTKDSIKKALFSNKEQRIVQSKKWTSEYLEWSNEENDEIKRKMKSENHFQIWNNFKDNIFGKLIGGCLDTIIQIKDEPFFPKINKWKDAVIFLETSENKMSPIDFEKSLIKLDTEISLCKAVIFGKPKDEEYFDEYLEIIERNIKKPTIFNLNFGHTSPIFTIPYGGIITLDKNNGITIKK